jgi:hypothetical protein
MVSHELRFRSLFNAGRGYAFPCDEAGRVCAEALTQAARDSLARARRQVGSELASPEVVRLFVPAGAPPERR